MSGLTDFWPLLEGPLVADGLNRLRGSRLPESVAIGYASGSAMLTSEAIRLVLRQERDHEPIDSSRFPTSPAHDRGHAPTQAQRQDADRLCARRAPLGRLPAPLA